MKSLEEFLQDEEYKNLIVGTEVNNMVQGVYLKPGQGVLKYGSVLAVKEQRAVLLEKEEANKNAIGVLVETVDTGKTEEIEPILTQMYITGVFHKDALLFAVGTTLDDVEIELKKIGIYTKKMYE